MQVKLFLRKQVTLLSKSVSCLISITSAAKTLCQAYTVKSFEKKAIFYCYAINWVLSSLRAQTALCGVVAPCYQLPMLITRSHNSTQRSLSPQTRCYLQQVFVEFDPTVKADKRHYQYCISNIFYNSEPEDKLKVQVDNYYNSDYLI